MKGSSYMIYDQSNTCYTSFTSSTEMNDKNYWLLGLPFYRQLMIVHDMDNYKIGLKANSNGKVLV